MEKFPDVIPGRIKQILSLYVLNSPSLTFKQASGTAMGTWVAPTFANLIKAYLEVQIYEQARRKLEIISKNAYPLAGTAT